MISLTRRLSIGLLLTALTTMLLLAQGSMILFDYAVRAYLYDRLQKEAEGIMSATLGRTQSLSNDEFSGDAFAYQRVYSGVYYTIEKDNKPPVRSRSLWDYNFPDLTHHRPYQLVVGPVEQKLLLWQGTFRHQAHTFHIVTALDYTPITRRLSLIRLSTWGLGGVMALVLVMVQRTVIRSSLKPFKQLREELMRLNAGHQMQLHTRVPLEVAPVVNELNHQLERIDKVLKRSRDGIANLSHALKTPLAVMESLLSHQELREHPRLQNELRHRLDDIHRLVERELQRARLDTRDENHTARFAPDVDLPPLMDTLRTLYPQIHFTARPDEHPILPWDREDVLEVLGNLLDNAGKWASTRVRLTFTDTDDALQIGIEDDGPGIAPERRADVLQRGTRLDERVSGHGLGLGIVTQIVHYHGGELRLEDSEWGGLNVILTLPWP